MYFNVINILVLLGAAKSASAIIYGLNDSQYLKMPPLYQLDDYKACLLEPGGTYCLVDVHLSNEDSKLMRFLQEYSDHKTKHFNHTQIHRGVCVTQTCKQYIQNNASTDLNGTLQECMNESTWKNYQLNGTLTNVLYCNKEDDKVDIGWLDIVVGVVYLVIIMCNVVGSLYDLLMFEKDDTSGNPYLLSFSLRRNWDRLVAPITEDKEPRLERLRLFHGMRTMTMVCVFFSHSVLIMAYSYVENPQYIETAYEDPLKQLLFNGSLVTHTFFVMSSFLMAYKFMLHAEKHPPSWIIWPKGILMRWLRLTPTYALIIATVCTWMRLAGSGPLWEQVVGSEAEACRRYWWAHLLYINNYVYADATCMPATWYLAADTQLFCIGLLVCVAARSPRAKVLALSALFLVALATPALHTWLQDLEAVVIQSPELYRNLYASDDTFRIVYIRGHTNLSTYTLGLAGGFLTYYWQTEKKDFNKYRSYRWAHWVLFPLGVAVILSGGLFYSDAGRAALPLRVLYATFYKPVFQLLIVAFIIGVVFKLETIYRGLVEWRGFTWTGRVSYSAYLLHLIFQRALIGSQIKPVHMSDYFVLVVLCATIFLTYMGAGALWLCVESPIGGVIKAVTDGPKKETGARNRDVERSKI